MNTPPSVPHAHKDASEVQKNDPSPSTFLPGLKSFNIEQAKYKHYGHLMTADQVEKIMVKNEEPKDLRSNLVLSSNLNPGTSPLDPPKRENRKREAESGTKKEAETAPEPSQNCNNSDTRLDHLDHLEHDYLMEPRLDGRMENQSILDHLLHALDVSFDKPYSEETMREMLRLRVEQERTKQTHYKLKLSQAVLQLLKEAESHGFGGDLIQKLFLDDTAADYRTYMHYLGSIPSEDLRRKLAGESIYVSHNVPMDHHQEHHVPHGHRPQPTHTPSPNKLPVADNVNMQNSHHFASGSHLALARHSVSGTQANSALESASSISGPSRLPNLPVYQLHVYPIYYAQMPEQMQQQVMVQQGHAQTNAPQGAPQTGQPGQPGQPGQSQSGQSGLNQQYKEDESLGLPYQKYPGVVYHSLPPQFRNSGPGLVSQPMTQPMGQQLIPQGGRPYYYVNSLPPGMRPVMTSQYFVPPLLPSGMVPWGTSAPTSYKKPDEDHHHHHHKRQKGNKNSINFMITTPKNPPAKKYNKL